ncbi:hypothetical protein LCGC14_2277060 [marine sediment metagenome]|uniref:Uncharacterized protein n=1 Tax=marine sediment metagenome TaxID=412755 RepID=A0A0F9DHJ6_9ZZZZ
MSVKSFLMAAGIEALIFVVFGYFYGEHKDSGGYDRAVATLSQDSMAVTTDTVWAVADTVIRYEWLIVSEAVIDTVNEVVTYSTRIDTAAVMGKDTVAVISQDISLTEDIFEILMKIDIRPVEKIINVVKTEFRTVVKEVRISEFPNTFLTGFISAVITIIAVALALL